MKFWGIVVLAAAGMSGAVLAAEGPVDVQAYVKRDRFGDIKISPTGDYYAATLKETDYTSVVILRRADKQFTANIGGGTAHANEFEWVSPERVVVSIAEQWGALETPRITGELFAANADGSHRGLLVGQRVANKIGTRIQDKKSESVVARLQDDLAGDDRNIIVSIEPFTAEPFSRAERMDVFSGRRTLIARAPVGRADFAVDNSGEVRFAVGRDIGNASKLYYRAAGSDVDAEWTLVNDENVTGRSESAIGFSADNKIAYLWAEQNQGPDAIVAYDTTTQARTTVLRDDNVDPARIIYRNGTRIPIGAFFMDGRSRTEFFDKTAPEARLYRSLEAAFKGEAVRITSQTSDGRLAVVEVSSDRNPGDFYLFDTVAKKADHIFSRSEWLDRAQSASMQPVALKARDGLDLHGYLTTPAGSSGKNLPLVVMPHGGPFGVQNDWTFTTDAQVLARAGYAVLQLNFRGSSGYGKAFLEAGARQWGQAMQDDLTDATRWAIQQGVADAGRVCIYGASYGAYAALMGVAKEPDLYKCAVGYVGVYDLVMRKNDLAGDAKWAGNWAVAWMGEADKLASISPTNLADRIKAPVFLAAGGEDWVVPLAQSKKMESALKKAGVPVETLYIATEGHGFYTVEHKHEFYTRLLAFLSRHLGGAVAANDSGAAASAAK